jgi:beta-phosphoglucomutase-like phosphatase (HAD superfamily)
VTARAETDGGRAGVLGLPAAVIACLFDLDGVLTDTAVVHDKAWAEMVDAFLRERAERTGESFVAFDHADALRAHDADIVVEDLAELLGDTEREAAR